MEARLTHPIYGTQIFLNDLLYSLVYCCVPTDPQPDISTDQEPATRGQSAGIVVGISIAIFMMSFSAGVLLATLIMFCCRVRGRGKNSEQPHLTSSEDPQPTPVYDEVGAGKLEVKENVAYGPVDKLELKQNPSYGPVRH